MKILAQASRIFLVFTLLLGLLHPAVITLLAQGAFPAEANGSLVERKGRLLGSRLIGQGFKEARYFWPRPSAVDFNPLPSGGSNASATSAALAAKVAERAAAGAPEELRYASASGLDPEISPAAAAAQVSRVAAARSLRAEDEKRLQGLVVRATKGRFAGFLGEPTVNVLELNLAVDEAF
jgi:potassium-transporting ATPase KdpC subunit